LSAQLKVQVPFLCEDIFAQFFYDRRQHGVNVETQVVRLVMLIA
jgi:hypothetical protein